MRMDSIEDVVRDSFRHHAGAVEPSPELWSAVERRIARRRRQQVASWSVAGAAAVLSGILVVPGVMTGPGPQTPEIAPAGPLDVAPPAARLPAGPLALDPAPFATSELPAPTVLVGERELVLAGQGGEQRILTLPEEGGSRFLDAHVRPGSSVDDLTLIALTAAEGMYDLRYLRYLDGEVVIWEPFAPPYTPSVGSSPDTSVAGPVWSPDGDFLAWFEQEPGGTTMRTVGWDEGPGTGDPATDNASFALDGLPPRPVSSLSWARDPAATVGRIVGVPSPAEELWFAVAIEVQADGALALPPGRNVEVMASPDGNEVLAVMAVEGGQLQLLRGQDGPELVAISSAGGVEGRLSLPGEVAPEGAAEGFWLRRVGGAVLLGSAEGGGAWIVTDGRVRQLDAAPVGAAPVE